MSTLGTIGSILIWISGIVVLIKLFQTEGLLKGILGLICMLYTFIWGWQNVKKEDLKLRTWMMVWTGAILVGIVLNVIGSMSAIAGGGE
ncbi:MAG: hypothetical protein WCK35_03570 [Chloroflexota bacterium]